MPESENTIGIYEKLPLDVIERVEYNPALKPYIDNPSDILHYLLSEDRLLREAGVFGLAKDYRQFSTTEDFSNLRSNNEIIRFSAPSSLRGITLRQFEDPILIERIAYTEFDAKGNGMTAEKWQERQLQSLLIKREDPQGMTGSESGRLELLLSEQFFSYGGRTNRLVANIHINNQKFRAWVQNYPEYNEYNPQIALDIVEKNGDHLTIPIRLTNPRYVNIREKLSRGRYSADHMVNLGVRAYHTEVSFDEKLFRRTYTIPSKLFPENISDNLGKLLQGEKTKETLDTFFKLESYLMGFNYGRFARLSLDVWDGRLLIKYPQMQLQDLSIGGLWNDYESAIITEERLRLLNLLVLEPDYLKKQMKTFLLEGLDLYCRNYQEIISPDNIGRTQSALNYRKEAYAGVDQGYEKPKSLRGTLHPI